MTAYDHARTLTAAGISVIPIRLDTSKAPAVNQWKPFQSRIATDAELDRWYAADAAGLAVVGGAVSGNLECIDFDDPDAYPLWLAIIKEELSREQIRSLSTCATPSGGIHVRYRVAGFAVPGNQKLAFWMPHGKLETRIETRGEGGYFLCEGNPPEAHESAAPYTQTAGPALADLSTITEETRNILINAARLLDETPPVETRPARVTAATGSIDEKPGDAYSRRGPDWSEILTGWTCVRDFGGKRHWRRPGKTSGGISATTGHCSADGRDLLAVFSSNAHPFEGPANGKPCTCYSKFAAYALIEHRGDFAAAARELGRQGWGAPPRSKDQRKRLVAAAASTNWPTAELDTAGRGEIDLADETEAPPANPAAPFPLHLWPSEMRNLCREISESLDCPVDFAAVGCLTTAAAAIGGTRSVSPKSGWNEEARLYACIIAEPGGAKSPSLAPVIAPLMNAQRAAEREYAESMADFTREKAEWERKRENYSDGNGADPGRQPVEPPFRHVWTSDCTVEAIAKILSENPRGLACLIDELSALMAGMNQYKGGKGRDRQAWLSAWSGAEWKVDRRNQPKPLMIRSPFVCVLGGIQPDMAGEMLEDERRDDGFVHRFLFSYPDAREWSPWSDRGINPRTEELWARLVGLLFECDFEYVQEEPRAVVLHLNPEAKQLATEWYNRHVAERNDDIFLPQLAGPWAKFRQYLFRLALVAHVMRQASGDTDEADIDAASMTAAVETVEYFKSHARRAYQTIREDDTGRTIRRVVAWLAKRPGQTIKPRDLIRAHFAETAEEAAELLQTIAKYGHGIIETEKTASSGKVKFSLRTAAEKKIVTNLTPTLATT